MSKSSSSSSSSKSPSGSSSEPKKMDHAPQQWDEGDNDLHATIAADLDVNVPCLVNADIDLGLNVSLDLSDGGCMPDHLDCLA
jgi:hypothetical protein